MTMNKFRGPFKAILSTRQGDLIDYTHSRSFEAARNWLGVIGSNAVGLILDRDGFPVWESAKLDADGNVIRNNPDSIHIDIGSHNTKGRNVRAKNPGKRTRAAWQTEIAHAKALFAAGDERGAYDTARYLYTEAQDDYSKAGEWALNTLRNLMDEINEARYGNPTPRLTRYDQPSQRERISPRTGRPTKAPSKRLKTRRLKTHHLAPPGVWANPLTRVKLKSPAQRPAGAGEVPEKGSRLYKRRQTTAKAPPGFYANPAPAFLYVVHRADANGQPAYMMAAFRSKAEAIAAAKKYANGSGTPYVIEKRPL